MEFYVLDGHTSEYVTAVQVEKDLMFTWSDVVQDLSQLYRNLAFFELDPDNAWSVWC